MTDAPTAFPLAWPHGRPRARTRTEGRFSASTGSTPESRHLAHVTLAKARARLAGQLERLGGRAPILSSNVELRIDGQPRSGLPEPRDPGVALYFTLATKPIVLACDRFTEVAQNIAAIAAHIDATRRIERYGVATAEQMFTGFLALPAPMVVDDWRAVLGNPTSLNEAETAYRERMRTAHPDAGGTHAAAAALSAAIAMARTALRANQA